MSLIDPTQSSLMVIDIQQRLLPAVTEPKHTLSNAIDLVSVANLLEIPVVYSEQYPKGLGPTEPSLMACFTDHTQRIEKSSFSCLGDPLGERQIEDALTQRQIIVCGMETHVCVLQTVIELLERHFEVFVVLDAVSSRRELDKKTAIARMRQCGAHIITKEMCLFEWLKTANHEHFKTISKTYIR